MEEKKKKIKISDIVLIVLLIVAVVFEFGKFTFVTGNDTLNSMINMTITRLVAGAFFLILILTSKYKVFGKITAKEFLLVIPCFIVAVNNMPIYGLITKECEVTGTALEIGMFFLECLAVGIFEELAFRGLFLPMVLEKHHKTRKEVIISLVLTSAVFGAYHLINLAMGAGIGPTLLQVCYSALIGAMCACAFLITGNVIVSIAIHTIYNFCGLLVSSLGKGNMLNVPTIIVTALLGVIVFVYMLVLFIKKDKLEFLENFES